MAVNEGSVGPLEEKLVTDDDLEENGSSSNDLAPTLSAEREVSRREEIGIDDGDLGNANVEQHSDASVKPDIPADEEAAVSEETKCET